MPKFTYLGISAKQKKEMIEKQSRNLDPPEKRGKPMRYHIDKDDTDAEKEEKKKLTKKWKDEQIAEIVKGVDGVDARAVFVDPAFPGDMKLLVFEKGKAVYLPSDHPLVPKLQTISVGQPQPKIYPTQVIVKHECFKMEDDKPEKEEKTAK